MKKQKVIVLDSEQQNKQEILAISKMQEGLNKMEQFPVYSPDLQWFEQMVLAEKQRIRKKLIRDLSIYLIVAIIILCGIMISLFQMPAVFIFLQIATTIFIAFYSGTRLMKKVNGG
ncbi:YxlC family protein [Neobacillus bataviensis]|uniref:YxlC family protein n=1 Tax=Neobacillus bataviensis TaxID=220685 RepID=UPI001CBC764F|nr:YxlC family protein [Neobacillus bataviensis]